MRRSDRIAALAVRHPTPFRWMFRLSRLRLLPTILHRHWLAIKVANAISAPAGELQWARVVMNQDCERFLRSINHSTLSALEISPGYLDTWKQVGFASYEGVDYPTYDVCTDVLPRQFDVIVADQVFEHIRSPWRAARNILQMLRAGGHFIVMTPFLIKVHQFPIDCYRWTETGIRFLLEDAGFVNIETHSWGNRACVVANFTDWRSYGWWHSLKNEPDYPVVVWAFAQRT